MTLSEIGLLHYGKPYVYGANGPNEFDCCSLVNECLRSIGKLDAKDYYTDSLYAELSRRPGASSSLEKDAIVFYGTITESGLTDMVHVGISMGNGLIVEAAGEGRVNTDNGYVRIRPLEYRSDLVAGILL